MTTSLTRFRVGHGIGLITESTMFLLDAAGGPLAEQAWSLMQMGATSEELLEAISATGLRALGSFALAQIEEVPSDEQTTQVRAVRVVARGSATIDVGSADGPRTLSGESVRTWVEDVVPFAGSIELRLGAEGAMDVPFRVDAGVVPAVAIARVLVEDPLSLADIDVQDADGLVELIPVPPRSGTTAAGPAPGPDDLIPLDLPATTVAAQSIETDGNCVSGLGTTPPVASGPPIMAPSGATDPGRTITAADLGVGGADDGHDADDYDAIYGRTIMRSVHQAAVVPTDAADGVRQDPPTLPAVPNGLIDGIPGTPAAAPMAGDHDGRTISRAQLAAMRTAHQPGVAAASSAPPPAGPVVQASACPAGHPNPPQRGLCRRCGQAIPTGTHVLVARPVLGVLRFSTGVGVSLDRPALIGRNPRIEGQIPNELPQVVRLDIGQGLSRTHAAIRLEGWQVYLEDLNSANGTTLTLPGRAPRRLHPGEPALLEHGALVDLGGEVTCTYEEAM